MKILYFAYIRDITGCKQEPWPAEPDMRTLLRSLCAKYGETLRKKIYAPGSEEPGDVILMVNGRHIEHLGGLDAALVENDTIHIFPMVAGG
ncbi:MAG: MoaD family protein [Clostridiales bacterium]|nr:MoaD family protein [Clostridiales bacterium]